MLDQLPTALKRKSAKAADAPPPESSSVACYFDVLASSINIMQDHVTHTRLAAEPPQVMLVLRLRSIGLIEFDRAHEVIADGRACVEQALPTLRRYLYRRQKPAIMTTHLQLGRSPLYPAELRERGSRHGIQTR
jgi:predicted acylesterase/phospholipase RssA